MKEYIKNSRWEITQGKITRHKIELTIEIDNKSINLIYDETIDGYFCCIPEMGLGCIMGKPKDIGQLPIT